MIKQAGKRLVNGWFFDGVIVIKDENEGRRYLRQFVDQLGEYGFGQA